jgi:hypothetical protein
MALLIDIAREIHAKMIAALSRPILAPDFAFEPTIASLPPCA